MQSNRIFSTVFYPNAFAGAILLFTPIFLGWVWQAEEKLTLGARGFIVLSITTGSAACLYWTGSKGGWLVALIPILVVAAHLSISKKVKIAVMLLILIAGTVGLYVKNAEYVNRGSKSVVARFDYWEAALKTTLKHPIVGTGPGTFGVAYDAIRRPESEMARLTHNDYLQQASDSGIMAFLLYSVIVIGVIVAGYNGRDKFRFDLASGIWLGFLAWAIQSNSEFNLYVPPLGWTAFAMAGLMVARKDQLKWTTSTTAK